MLAPMRPTPTKAIFLGLGRLGSFFFAVFLAMLFGTNNQELLKGYLIY